MGAIITVVTKEFLELIYNQSHLYKFCTGFMLNRSPLGVTMYSTLWEGPTEPFHQVFELELDLEILSLFGTLGPLPY